jgi:hypothetical protein
MVVEGSRRKESEMILKKAHPLVAGAVTAVAYFACGMLFGHAAPVRLIALAVAVGAFVAVGRHRERAGRKPYPVWVTVGLIVVLVASVTALAVLAGPPSGADWVPLILIYAFVIWMLRSAWRESRT